jgi:hypothetical protein
MALAEAMAAQRRFLTALTALAVVAVVLQAVTGQQELALHLTPLFLIVALLLSGHYVAEDRIVEGWLARRPSAARRIRARWPAGRETALPSLLDRSPLCRRGPPVVAAPLC